MRYLISKPARNAISGIKNKLLGKPGPEKRGGYFSRYFALQSDRKSWVGMPTRDDFNWALYNLHYRDEIEAESKEYSIALGGGDYLFSGNKLSKASEKIMALHPVWQLLYETILQLDPKSVFELGVGNGMHLNNIKVLSGGKINLSGIDRSEDQIKYLEECYPDLNSKIALYDATRPFGGTFPPVDLAYTQAVIMHIKTGNSHLVALANLFNIAKKQVVLAENWNSHEFMGDIQRLLRKKAIFWEKLYMYYRTSELDPNVRVMICSRTPLDYPVLEYYGEMKKGLESQGFFHRLGKWLGGR